jgi:hypothetical protein
LRVFGRNLLLYLFEFGTHGINDFLVSLHGTGLLEDGTSGNHHVNTSLGNWTLSREQDLG